MIKGSRQVDHSIYSLFIARKTNLPASLSRHIYVTLSAFNAYVKCIAWSVPSPKSSSSYRPKRMQQPGYNIFPTWRQMCRRAPLKASVDHGEPQGQTAASFRRCTGMVIFIVCYFLISCSHLSYSNTVWGSVPGSFGFYSLIELFSQHYRAAGRSGSVCIPN